MTGPVSPVTPYACASCGNPLQPTDRFCGACGALVGACRTCGASLVAGDRFCPQCGMAVQPGAYGPTTPAPGGMPPGAVNTGPGFRTVMGRMGAAGTFGAGVVPPPAAVDPWQQVLTKLRVATL